MKKMLFNKKAILGMAAAAGLAWPVSSYFDNSRANSTQSIAAVERLQHDKERDSNYDLIKQYGILDVHREFIENVGKYGVSIFGESIEDIDQLMNG